eukprot:3098133-Prorocentrum_lima.AAC.1
MTSSLVGSEMCIRDSACAAHRAVRCALRRLRATACGRDPRTASLAPVSYTHLTLPTICSV